MVRILKGEKYILGLLGAFTLNQVYRVIFTSFSSEQFDVHATNFLHKNAFIKDNSICEKARHDFRTASGLFGIVTGSEHSGTTIVSQLIMSAPDVYGGIECGMLLAPEPSKFTKNNPFYRWMLKPVSDRMWGLNEAQRRSLLESTCHAEMYARLRKHSGLYSHPPNDHSLILDKTPRYVFDLVTIMDRTPGVPVVVTQKSRADQVKSLMKRRFNADSAKNWTAQAERGVRMAQEKYPDRLHVVNMTTFYLDTNVVMEKVFRFLGLSWRPEYLTMNALNSKSSKGARDTLPFTSTAGSMENRTQRFTDIV